MKARCSFIIRPPGESLTASFEGYGLPLLFAEPRGTIYATAWGWQTRTSPTP